MPPAGAPSRLNAGEPKSRAVAATGSAPPRRTLRTKTVRVACLPTATWPKARSSGETSSMPVLGGGGGASTVIVPAQARPSWPMSS